MRNPQVVLWRPVGSVSPREQAVRTSQRKPTSDLELQALGGGHSGEPRTWRLGSRGDTGRKRRGVPARTQVAGRRREAGMGTGMGPRGLEPGSGRWYLDQAPSAGWNREPEGRADLNGALRGPAPLRQTLYPPESHRSDGHSAGL